MINLKLEDVRSAETGNHISTLKKTSIDYPVAMHENSADISISSQLTDANRPANAEAMKKNVQKEDFSEPSSMVLIGVGCVIIILG